MDEGQQYRLGGITFSHNRAIKDTNVLRGLFPVQDGDIFSRQKLAKGLENLRTLYGEIGHINFTAVPDTKFDEELKLGYLEIDLDEGKQFRVSSFDLKGLDEASRQELLSEFPIGQIHNERLFRDFLEKHASTLKFMYDNLRMLQRDSTNEQERSRLPSTQDPAHPNSEPCC